MAESLDNWRRWRLGRTGKAVLWVSDLQDVAFDFETHDVSQPLFCQPIARCLHLLDVDRKGSVRHLR